MSPPVPIAPAPGRGVAWGNVIRLLLALALVGCCWSVTGYPDQRQDFLLRYQCVRLWMHGGNPYDPHAIAQFFTRYADNAYVYPPDTLWLFGVFNLLPYPVAALVYLALQLVLAGAVYFCWQRFFLPRGERDSAWFAAFCFFGLRNAVSVDLLTGNISLVEQAFLWFGLAAYLRGRYGWFCVLLFVAGAFKLTLLGFSALLLAAPVRQWGKFVLFWSVLAVRLALGAFFSPVMFANFVHGMRRLSANALEDGSNNPSVRKCLEEIAQYALVLDDGPARVFVLIAQVLIGAAVVWFSWQAWQVIRQRTAADAGGGGGGDPDASGVLTVCLFTVVYALLVPRLKDYSCIVLLLPLWRLARVSFHGRFGTWMAVIALGCLCDHSPWPLLSSVYWFLWRYQAIMLAFVVWVAFVRVTRRGREVVLGS